MLKLKLQYFDHLKWRAYSFEKTLMLRKIEGRRGRGDRGEMVGWPHQLNGHEFEWTLRVGDGQGGLACCSPWGRKELDTSEKLNETELRHSILSMWSLFSRSFVIILFFSSYFTIFLWDLIIFHNGMLWLFLLFIWVLTLGFALLSSRKC